MRYPNVQMTSPLSSKHQPSLKGIYALIVLCWLISEIILPLWEHTSGGHP